MATKPKAFVTTQNNETLDFDIATFKLQQAQLKRVAVAQVATKIDIIKNILREVKDLVELSRMNIRVRSELESAIGEVDELNPEWNSSSYNC